MKEVKVASMMSLFDVALYWCGNINYAWHIARLNKLPLTYTFLLSETCLVPYLASIPCASGLTMDEQNRWIDADNWLDDSFWTD